MLAGLSNCVTVKGTPSAITMLSVSNPTGQIPKLVHVKCPSESTPVTDKGWVLECWYTPDCGILNTKNGSSGVATGYYQTSVQQTPTAVNNYCLTASTIELYKGTGSATGKWSTDTEYTVEIYT